MRTRKHISINLSHIWMYLSMLSTGLLNAECLLKSEHSMINTERSVFQKIPSPDSFHMYNVNSGHIIKDKRKNTRRATPFHHRTLFGSHNTQCTWNLNWITLYLYCDYHLYRISYIKYTYKGWKTRTTHCTLYTVHLCYWLLFIIETIQFRCLFMAQTNGKKENPINPSHPQ